MAQRQVIASALDVGRHSFGECLDKHMGKLKQELLLECDRIASSRELLLKKELNELRKEKEELQGELRKVIRNCADGALQAVQDGTSPAGKSQGSDSKMNSSPPENTTGTRDQIETSGDIEIGLVGQAFPEEEVLSPSKSHHEHTDSFRMWSEWKDLLSSSSGTDLSRSRTNIDQQIDDENAEIENGNILLMEPEEDEGLWISTKSWCTISPNSGLVIFWEVVGIPILFYDLVTIPMQVFYKPQGTVFDIVGWVLILYWTFDLLSRLLVIGAITKDGLIKLQRIDFMKIYLRHSFPFDFCMVAPDWFAKAVGAGGMRNVAILRLLRILRLMRLMRMSKMKKLFRNLEDAIDSEYFTVGVSLIINLLAVLGMCHYVACFWFWLGTVEIEGQSSWVDASELNNAAWEYQYIICLHWAIAQFTPGASRIQPTNGVEAAGSVAVLIFGLIFLSLFISALSQARMRLQAMTSKVDRDNWMLRRYLRQQGVTLELQVRTMRYVEQCVEPMFSRVQRKDVFLLQFLSRPLQLEVQEEQYYHTLIAHPLFKSLRERSLSLTLHLFTNVIIEILLADDDLLFESGSVAHEMYFVSKGGIKYISRGHKNQAASMKYLSVGSWCCEAVLWVEWVHKGTAKADKETTVISIDSAKLRSAVLEHKERAYVSKCAGGYVQDLDVLSQQGEIVNDVTKVSDGASSAFLMEICGTSVLGKSAGHVGKHDGAPEGAEEM